MAAFWQFKGCPRCHGDMYISLDPEEGWVKQCLQCSYKVFLKVLAGSKQPSKRLLKPIKFSAKTKVTAPRLPVAIHN